MNSKQHMNNTTIIPPAFRFECTCSSSPEQYNVYNANEQVAYIHLRHGELTCYVPDVNGEIIYQEYIDEDDGWGFANQDVKERHLAYLATLLNEFYSTESSTELTPLQKARLKQREMREAGLLASRSPAQKFIDSPRLGRAVKMFCYECNGYSRKEANECRSSDCALWLFRKGRSTPQVEEVRLWQKHYSHHLEAAGEISASGSDILPPTDIQKD